MPANVEVCCLCKNYDRIRAVDNVSFKAGEGVFPSLSNQTAMLIFAAIMILYTFLGGFKAVCWTDFFQGLLMLVAVLAIPIMIVATEQLDTGLLSKVIVGNDGTEYAFGSSLFTASWKDIASGLAWGLGYFGMPHIIVRFMSIEKASMVKKIATVAIIWVILSLGSVCLIAYFGRHRLQPFQQEK